MTAVCKVLEKWNSTNMYYNTSTCTCISLDYCPQNWKKTPSNTIIKPWYNVLPHLYLLGQLSLSQSVDYWSKNKTHIRQTDSFFSVPLHNFKFKYSSRKYFIMTNFFLPVFEHFFCIISQRWLFLVYLIPENNSFQVQIILLQSFRYVV